MRPHLKTMEKICVLIFALLDVLHVATGKKMFCTWLQVKKMFCTWLQVKKMFCTWLQVKKCAVIANFYIMCTYVHMYAPLA
jgi:hypothetical protein